MSERSRELAEEFERANESFIAAVEALSGADWRARCEPEGWTVAAGARHVGSWYPLTAAIVREIAAGRPMSMTGEQMDEINDREAIEHAACGKKEVIALLRQEGDAIARLVRTLTDEQLRRSSPVFFGREREVTAENIIERVLISHIGSHRKSIEAAAAK
jgi:DinB superfamily